MSKIFIKNFFCITQCLTLIGIQKITAMRKIILCLVFTCSAHIIANAQSGFFNEPVHYYEYYGLFPEGVWPVKVDSSSYNNGDTTLYFNSGMISYHGSYCIDTAGVNIVGPKTTKLSNGDYLFYNRYGDSIPIYMDKAEGEEWVCYMDSSITVNATVESISTSSFGENYDIIHTIRFRVESDDSNMIYSSVGNDFITIGEKSGVLKTLAWVIFPYRSHENLSPRNRISKGDFIGGTYPSFDDVINVSEAEIHDFHVGDEFHIEYYYWRESPFYVDVKLYKYRTINRSEDADNVSIRYLRERQIGVDSVAFDDWGNGTMFYLYGDVIVDTITRLYSKTDYSLSRPLFYKENGTNALTKIHNRPAYMQSSLSVWANPNDSCGFFDELLPVDEYYYIKGLGGPYYRKMEHEYYMINDEKTLKYYSLADGSTYGDPIQFVGIESISQQSSFQVYPNPAENTLNLKFKNHLANNYRIHDITGRLVQQGSLPASQELKVINISSLSKGAYLIVIQQDGRLIGREQIIKN